MIKTKCKFTGKPVEITPLPFGDFDTYRRPDGKWYKVSGTLITMIANHGPYSAKEISDVEEAMEVAWRNKKRPCLVTSAREEDGKIVNGVQVREDEEPSY
jgi:hypothetical protein